MRPTLSRFSLFKSQFKVVGVLVIHFYHFELKLTCFIVNNFSFSGTGEIPLQDFLQFLRHKRFFQIFIHPGINTTCRRFKVTMAVKPKMGIARYPSRCSCVADLPGQFVTIHHRHSTVRIMAE
jgi:hypothetical protein